MELAAQDGTPASSVRRIRKAKNDWTLKEHEVLVTYWPDVSLIRRALPHRSEAAIRNFAGKCNLRKQIHHWTPEQDQLLRKLIKEGVTRKQIGKELGLTFFQVGNRMRYTGLSYGRRPPKPTGHKVMDSIRRRLFDLNMSSAELDEACGTGKAFQKWSPRRCIAMKNLIRAIKELDGELSVEWSSLADNI